MLYKKQAKISFFSLVLLFLIAASFFVIQADKYASAELFHTDTKIGTNFDGFAWSENYGWVSFNSSNCDTDDNDLVDNVPPATPGCPSGANIADYGVNVNYRNDTVSGYAWSSNIGWISFNGTSYDSANGELAGTAQIVALGADGGLELKDLGGTISFGATTTIDQLSSGYGKFNGYAWNENDTANTGMGWLKFRGVSMSGDKYVVFADLNYTPTADTYTVTRVVPATANFPALVFPFPGVGSGFVNEGDTIEFSANWTDLDDSDNARLFICKENTGDVSANVDTSSFGNPVVIPTNQNSVDAGIKEWTCQDGEWCSSSETTASTLTCSAVMDGSVGYDTGNTYWSTVCDEFANCTTPVESAQFDVNDKPVITGFSASSLANDVVSSPPEVDAGDNTIRFSADWMDAVNNTMRIYACRDGSAFSPLTGCASEWVSCAPVASAPGAGTVSCNYNILNSDGVGDKDYEIYVCDERDACSAVSLGTFYVNDRPIISTMEAPIWVPGDACDNPVVNSDLKASTTWTFSDSEDQVGGAMLMGYKFKLRDETGGDLYAGDNTTLGDAGCINGADAVMCDLDISPGIEWNESYSIYIQVKDRHAWSQEFRFDHSLAGYTLSDDATGINTAMNNVAAALIPIDPKYTFTTYLHNFPIAIASDFTSFPEEPSAGEEVKLYPYSKYSIGGITMASCEDGSGECSYAWSIPATAGEFKNGTQNSTDAIPIVIFYNDDVAVNQEITLTVIEIDTGYECSGGGGFDTNKALPSWIETH